MTAKPPREKSEEMLYELRWIRRFLGAITGIMIGLILAHVGL